ncbi:MAG: hypothetical protein K9N51_04030 [Candidatus Pacebacteria bacterium]|nr:hypothetical protein [Candidatus Paceibacterota bacterium]
MRSNVFHYYRLFWLCLSFCGAVVSADYMDLGHGYYASVSNLTERAVLDVARFDWLYIPHGRPATTADAINRLREYNPDLKVVYSLRPTHHLGHGPSGLATCLDYCYDADVRAEIHRRIEETVAGRESLARPEALYGWVFWEELPMWFARPGEKDWIEPYRDRIEEELGEPLTYGDELDAWILKTKYVKAMTEIHQRVHELHPEAVIFYHHHPNKGTQGFEFADIVGKPWCQGLVAHHNITRAFERWVERAQELDAVYFTQLSHPAGMRAQGWEGSRKNTIGFDTSDRNLGYFFYCSGDCASTKGHYHLEDPVVRREFKRISRADRSHLHLARFCTQGGIGIDVVERFYRANGLSVDAEIAFAKARPGDRLPLRVTVTNRRELCHFANALDAVAQNIKIEVRSPRAIRILEEPVRHLARLGPMQSAEFNWTVEVVSPSEDGVFEGFEVVASCEGTDPMTVDLRGSPCKAGSVHHLSGRSGRWLEPNWEEQARLCGLRVSAAHGLVSNITFSSGGRSLRVEGGLIDGEILTVSADGTAELSAENLCPDTGLVDDPDKAKRFTSGYSVHYIPVGRSCTPDRDYRLTVTGSAEDGAGALVTVYFRGPKTELHLMHNALRGEGWQEATRTFTAPAGATAITGVRLWRYHQTGAIRYGSVSITPAIPEKPGSVVSRIQGDLPLLAPRGASDIRCQWEGPGELKVQCLAPDTVVE